VGVNDIRRLRNITNNINKNPRLKFGGDCNLALVRMYVILRSLLYGVKLQRRSWYVKNAENAREPRVLQNASQFASTSAAIHLEPTCWLRSFWLEDFRTFLGTFPWTTRQPSFSIFCVVVYTTRSRMHQRMQYDFSATPERMLSWMKFFCPDGHVVSIRIDFSVLYRILLFWIDRKKRGA